MHKNIYIHTQMYISLQVVIGNHVAYPRFILAYYSFHLRVTFMEPFSITSDIDVSNGMLHILYYFRYYFYLVLLNTNTFCFFF